MKADIHPKNYRLVIFKDNSSGERFLIGSTIKTTATDKWTDGNEYPLSTVDVQEPRFTSYSWSKEEWLTKKTITLLSNQYVVVFLYMR